jgi:hypothetical protein
MKLAYELTNVEVEAFGEIAERLLATGCYKRIEDDEQSEAAPTKTQSKPTSKNPSGKKTTKK